MSALRLVDDVGLASVYRVQTDAKLGGKAAVSFSR
jgi:hypothetical protein